MKATQSVFASFRPYRGGWESDRLTQYQFCGNRQTTKPQPLYHSQDSDISHNTTNHQPPLTPKMPRQTSDAPSLSAPAPKRLRAAVLKNKPDISGDISEEEEEGERVVVSEKALKNCVLCSDKEGRNLAGLWDVKYHYAVCYYNAGAMFEVVDAGDDNSREGGVREPVQKFRCSLTWSC